jgi:hypothetical protein
MLMPGRHPCHRFLTGMEFLHECMPARAQVPGDQVRAGPLYVRCVGSGPLSDLRELGRELSPAMASHCRRCPFSYETAHQWSPNESRRAHRDPVSPARSPHGPRPTWSRVRFRSPRRGGVPYAPSAFTFITTGLTAALDRAEAAASGKNVLAHSPDVAQQLLRVGPARRDSASPVPVLLGAVRRQAALDQVVGSARGAGASWWATVVLHRAPPRRPGVTTRSPPTVCHRHGC